MDWTQRIAGLALGAVVVGLATPVFTDQAPPVNVPGLDKPVVVVTGEIDGTEVWSNSNYYVLRGAVTMVSDAPMRSARSCMLVMPKPVEDCPCVNPRPSSATESRSPSELTVDARIVIRRARA